MKAQTAAVLAFLRSRGADGATPAEARTAIGTDRLAARVWELRHLHGFDVEKAMERHGDALVARYVLSEPRPVQLGLFGESRGVPTRPGSPQAATGKSAA